MPAPTHEWQKSSYCGQGDSCVHVAATVPGTIHLTESSDPTAAILQATPTAFAALLRTTKRRADAETA
ncbi:DUF397 domain-containing protein [Streptomyces venezuelae]|uniref:DUF397 domain-containing protein n=1 Tax=Streptomyces venezuelae TaxID=54571 RepID=A0A5P2BCG3_STRVZ|nr:DUF397 domain-containing protein [Streptomyces venezuelae]QES27650.1 DUF397 domain-containing protein [Streptomyces venezuelae]